MDWDAFEELIRYILTNFYDYAALETNPQIFTLIKPPAMSANRAEFVRQFIVEVIEKLRPSRKEINPNSPEWRPYLILQKRYVEGLGLNELAVFLSISSRQLRRDHHRALEALTILLWNHFYPEQPREIGQSDETELDQMTFEVHKEALDPHEVLNRVYDLFKQRFEDQHIQVRFELSSIPLQVMVDRVVLRQILIGLFNEISHTEGLTGMGVKTLANSKEVIVELCARVGEQEENIFRDEEDNLERLRSWCLKIDAHLEDAHTAAGEACILSRSLRLQRAYQKVILVVDDQEPAINMFRRYLSQTNWKIVGTNRADQVMTLVHQLQPEIITLDVMMPQIDGWELLQTLKLNEETNFIPVIICSAWADPDLAQSLGAAAYLKKPITQKVLLEALEKLERG